MKILLCIRSDYLTNFAGDSKQLLETAKYLRREGLSITINCGQISDYADYDIVHLFNLTRITETYRFFKTAERFGKPVVITPIYWDLQKYYQFINDAQSAALWNYYRPFRREILQGCKMVYPASFAEADILREYFSYEYPFRIIYCGVSKSEKSLSAPEKLISLKPFLFCAARVCPRKNQLEVCRAADRIRINLVLAGNCDSKRYLEQCLAYPNVYYFGSLCESELQPLYQNAALHVLCSFVETPGLASLEAGLSTEILSTTEGSSVEYFGDFAHYCNPYLEDNLDDSILASLSEPKQPDLKRHIQSRFLWDDCLSPLFMSYREILG